MGTCFVETTMEWVPPIIREDVESKMARVIHFDLLAVPLGFPGHRAMAAVRSSKYVGWLGCPLVEYPWHS